MTLKVSAVALTVWGVAMLMLDVTAPAAFAVLVALGGVFLVTAVIDHRRDEADRAQVARICQRAQVSPHRSSGGVHPRQHARPSTSAPTGDGAGRTP